MLINFVVQPWRRGNMAIELGLRTVQDLKRIELNFTNLTASDYRFMDGVKRSIHAHCIVLLSQVLMSQVGSLSSFFFLLCSK